MTRDDVKKIFSEATNEQISEILDIAGADRESDRRRSGDAQKELEESRALLKKLAEEVEGLKASKTSGEEWKKKFEDLRKEVDDRDAQAKADADKKAREKSLAERFEKAISGKSFINEPTKAFYLKQFSDLAGDDTEKDAGIIHDITKDKTDIFKGVTKINLPGGTVNPSGKTYTDPKEIMKIKDTAERRQRIAENPHLFGIGTDIS